MNDRLATFNETQHLDAKSGSGSSMPRQNAKTLRFTYASGSQPLEGFTIKRGIGIGGFGEVYFALSDAGKEVAIKRIQRNLDVELRGVKQCLNLKHVNLIALWDIKNNDLGESWVVMEYVPGYNLRDKLERHPEGMPAEELKQWFLSICSGVNYLHKHGIVHRDLKPGNIFFDTDQHIVKIGDYGLSKFISCSKRSEQTESVGTFHYMAPEIGKGSYGKEIDIYALGVILYEMLSGRLPFDGESAHEIIMKHMTADVDLAPIPEPFRAGIVGALRKDPAERISSVQDLIGRLPWPETEINRIVGSISTTTSATPEVVSERGARSEEISYGRATNVGAPKTIIYIGDDGMEEIVTETAVPMRVSLYGRDLLEKGIMISPADKPFVPREPIAKALQGGLDGAIHWWNRSDVSVPVKVLVAVSASIILIVNSSWLIVVAIALGAVYLGYYFVRGWFVTDKTNVQLPETRSATRERHEKNVRNFLSQRGLSDRLTDLSGSMLVAACSCIVFSFVALAIKGGVWNFDLDAAAVYAWLAITSTLASWFMLIANKTWEHRKGDPWLRRLTMMICGFGLGALSFLIGQSFFVSEFNGSSAKLGETIPQLQVSNLLSSFLMFFTVWFAISQSWRIIDPARGSRLKLWRVGIGLAVGVLVAQVLGLNPALFGMVVVITSVASQLAAPLITFEDAAARSKVSSA
ncbi:MAG: protein kinase [Pirellulaceae bacterium]